MTSKRLIGITILLMNAVFTLHHASGEDRLSRSLSVESALQMLKGKSELTLIDVGNGSEFEKFRIPGSLNIPLAFIKTKTFLKSRPLVLIDEGHSYRQLLEECARLSGLGFTVSVMDGGLYQWKQKGGPLEGDPFAQRELNKLSPQTFFLGKGYENWTFIDVSRAGTADADPQTQKGIHIPYSNNTEQFISDLKAEARRPKETRFFSLLIYDEDGKSYEQVERQIQAAGIYNVLYLKGGFEGYKAFERQQASISQGKSETGTGKAVKTYRNCTTCP